MAKKTKKRAPLSRERVLNAAVKLADKKGLEALSMRNLARQLRVEAMSLYNHVANKDEILDGITDIVVGEIELPKGGVPWRPAMKRRAESTRAMFKRHPWALSMMETRTTPGPQQLRYYDAVIGCLREDGFSIELAAHAFSAIDSYIFGFVMQELKLPFDTDKPPTELAEQIMEMLPADEFPHFAEMVTQHTMKPDYAYSKEFAWGLDLVLDGLERAKS